MPYKQIQMIHVKFTHHGAPIAMGRLAIKDRNIFFEYSPSFIELGLELSPFKLPLKSGVVKVEDRIFDGLFGVFNDSLPDGWGRLLLDRKLMQLGINPGNLTPLDRLQYVGSRGMGALIYEPEILEINPHDLDMDLDKIAYECLQFQEYDDEQYIDDLLVMNGSSAGARPKIMISMINGKKGFVITNDHSENQSDWIIKFRSSIDPKDAGPMEYAYHLMAIEAGLEVPQARLFKSKKCKGYFGVQRFDRSGLNVFHMHTASGLLHVDHRFPNLDYETLIKATLWLTKDVREAEKLFRNAVFNVLSHNRDDHAKNFSFLMDTNDQWHVSPAYDLNFSSGPGGEHCTMVMGQGRNIELASLLKVAEIATIKKQTALEIIDQVKGAVLKWKGIAAQANVSKGSAERIQLAINTCLKNL